MTWGGNRRGPALDRFESRYIPEPNSGCWLWLGSTTKAGYGTFSVDGKQSTAQRFAYEQFIGPIERNGKGSFAKRCRICRRAN